MDGADQGSSTDRPPGYPAGFEVDVVLTDGATAHVRPILPSDGPRIFQFHERQSPRSIYFRYFSPRPRLTQREVDDLTSVDYLDRMALVALRGDELIGVARYDRWRHRSEAEVAFFVDDANHGRGLATVLLEHLAVRARDVGLTGFTASVLPENRKMIGVFTAAGFEAATRFADGVVEVRLGLTPTPEAEAAIEARARTAASQAVRRLLSPRSVAVIGAGRDPHNIGQAVVRNLQRAGFEGPVWPVNAKADHIASIRTVGSILDITDEVDLAVIAVPAPAVAQVVEECGRKQVYGVVILSSGFAEAGPEGAALEAEVLRVARSWGIRVVGPNCLGIVNTDPQVRLHATFVVAVPLRGRVSLLSESGMVGAAIIDRAREEGIGISSFVALGNRADVSGNDLLQYWEADEHTDVVCMYIESFGNARHFSRLARRLTRAKPVVAVKAGWLPGAVRPPEGHDLSDDALLRQTGVIRVPTLPALLHTARLLTSQPLPKGRRVGVIGNAGGSLAIGTDAAVAAGLELAEVTGATRAALAQLTGHDVGTANPVDLGLRAEGEDVRRVAEVMAADPGVDVLLAVYAPSLGGTAAEVRDALAAAQATHPDTAMALCVYGPLPAPLADGAATIPVYDAVDAAARALGRVADYATWLAQEEGEAYALDPASVARARTAVARALEGGPGPLDVANTVDVLRAVGVDVVPTEEARSLPEALAAAERLGYPVALKAACRTAMAKIVAAGLALDLHDAAALRSAWERMEERFGDGLVPALVQPMVEPGLDVAVAVHDHPEVGPVVSLRPGGANAALDLAAELQVLPLGDEDARRLVARSRLAPHLDATSRRCLEDLLLRVGALVEEVPELVGVAVNPIIVGDGRAVAIEVAAEVAPVEREPLPPIRRV
jgi:acyl-CoA synthetase (NDP forming)/RimJ/RimL family protein N-acetyltransferase